MTDIQKLSVFDSRIIQTRPAFAVNKGALSLTNAPFNAIGATSSQMNFNIQVPSLNVFIDREVLWTSGVNMRCSVAVAGLNPAAPLPVPLVNSPVLVFGSDCSLCAFPLSSMVSTLTATINDCVSSINMSDVLTEVLRMVNQRKNRLQRTTPTMLDKYRDYNDAVGTNNNPLAGYGDADDYDNLPNGAFWNIVFTDPAGNVLVGNGVYVDGADNIAYQNGVPVLGNTVAGNAKVNYQIYYRFTATEKLVLSPFIFSEECGDSVGLFGVNNIQLVFNFQQAERLLRNAPLARAPNGRTVSNVNFLNGAPFVNPRINTTFLTPSLDVRLPPQSMLPYTDYLRYVSTPNQAIQPGQSASLVSQTITLPQIPDMLIIYAKPSRQLLNNEADFYLPITNISVNFDNFSGLLSSMTTEQLYNMSVENGLEMDWNSWNGQGRLVNNTPAGAGAFSVSNANNVNLVGGFLVLRMGKDITLQSGQAPSVVGQYTLQFNLTVVNRGNVQETPNIYTLTVNSGFLQTQSGSTRMIKGVLTEADVINAPIADDAMTRAQLERMVGGGFWSKLGTALNKVKDFVMSPTGKTLVKGAVNLLPDQYKQPIKRGMEAVGYGSMGGAYTGGAYTGGRRKGLKALL